MLKTFNINSDVKVKLTPKGRELFFNNKDYEKYPRTLTEDRDGYSTWQLWVLMEEFGEHMYNSSDNCFETTILIDDKELNNLNLKRKGS